MRVLSFSPPDGHRKIEDLVRSRFPGFRSARLPAAAPACWSTPGRSPPVAVGCRRDPTAARSRVPPGRPPPATPARKRAGPELRNWATSAWIRAGGFRDELFLEPFGASALGCDALSAFVTAQRRVFGAPTPASSGGPPHRRSHRPHQGRPGSRKRRNMQVQTQM